MTFKNVKGICMKAESPLSWTDVGTTFFIRNAKVLEVYNLFFDKLSRL
jgi:hypothetical protein